MTTRPGGTCSLQTHTCCGFGFAFGVFLLGVLGLEGRGGVFAQGERRPASETYHWVLPAQHEGVTVVELHPGDCYVIQRVDGMVYFGDPLSEVRELQRQFGGPVAHLVEHPDEHAECQLAGCVDVARLTQLVTTRLLELGTPQGRRLGNHRPTPLDGMRGGAYSDVGSAERSRYRQAAEQRMAYRHLRTAGRDNCYEAKAPRTLTIHIRDGQQRRDRTGVYSGYVYLEHHHGPPRRRVAARWLWGGTTFGGSLSLSDYFDTSRFGA